MTDTAYNPREDTNEYVLTGLLDNIENSAIGSWNWLQERMEDDPNSWDDDVWRFMGQRLGGALIGAGVGSFGGPKGTLIGGLVGGVLGAERSAAILGNIPGMKQLAAAQDKLAGGARELNEKLTPWLDPRVAGWGTRALTDWALERGVRGGITKVKRNLTPGTVYAATDENLIKSMISDVSDDLDPDLTIPMRSWQGRENLGQRGFQETKTLLDAGIDPQWHGGDTMYSFPRIPDDSDFLWAGKRIVDAPAPKGLPMDVSYDDVRKTITKNDIDLRNFDFSNPEKATREFEILLRDALEVDQITKKHLIKTGEKRSRVIKNLTGTDAIGMMWNDYLAGYFLKFILSGKARNFDDAIKVILPDRTLYGSSSLARELRLWIINPEASSLKTGSGFTKAGSRPKRKEYIAALAKQVEEFQDPTTNIKPKFQAHHIRVISEEWKSFLGLSINELPKMRLLHKARQQSYPAGNLKGNRLIVLNELHDEIHKIFWPEARKANKEFFEIWDNLATDPRYTTAASRDKLVRQFHRIVEIMMRERIIPEIDKKLKRIHIQKSGELIGDTDLDWVVKMKDELSEASKQILLKQEASNVYDLPDQPTDWRN